MPVTIYCKGKSDNPTEMGDCPFTHKVRCVYNVLPSVHPNSEHIGKINFEVVDLGSKPDWFLAFHPDGSTPLWVEEKDGEDRYVNNGSDDICKLLVPEDKNAEFWKDASGDLNTAVGQLLPGLKQYISSKADEVEAKKQNLRSKLAVVEQHLSSHEGPFFTGSKPAYLDCKLFPLLYAIDSALPHFRQDEVLSEYPKLKQYLQYCMSETQTNETGGSTSIGQGLYSREAVIVGWQKHVPT